MLFFKLTNPAEVIMPNLVGMSKEDATKLLDESKLKLEVSSEEYNSEYAEGYIISQDPLYSDNYNIKEGSTIKVVVSKGIEEAIVPNSRRRKQKNRGRLCNKPRNRARFKSICWRYCSNTCKYRS